MEHRGRSEDGSERISELERQVLNLKLQNSGVTGHFKLTHLGSNQIDPSLRRGFLAFWVVGLQGLSVRCSALG